MPHRVLEIWNAACAFRYLRGTINVHKPANWGIARTKHFLQLAIKDDLNAMETRPPKNRVEISGSFQNENFQIVQFPSFADNVLAVGPRYEESDIKVTVLSSPPYMSSGVSILAINARSEDLQLRNSTMVSTFQLRCQLGTMTDDGTTTGRVRERSRFHHVNQGLMERCLSSMQAGFQRKAFEYLGVNMQSEEAFEIAKEGLVRPRHNNYPMMYSLKCTKFEPPAFWLEVQTINENDEYLRVLVCDIARKLKTTAALESMHRLRFGPFTSEQSLIKNFWSLENVLSNLRETEEHMDQWRYPKLFGLPDTDKESLTLLKKI